MILNIIKYPDTRLYQKSLPVDLTNGVPEDTKFFIQCMIETMYDSAGLGLSAIQMNNPQRIMVYDILQERTSKPTIIINPEIFNEDGSEFSLSKTNQVPSQEGCLSIPFVYDYVQRAKTIRVRGFDLDNQLIDKVCEDLEAACIQHEFDHMNSTLFIDYLSNLKRNMIKKSFSKGKFGQGRQMISQLQQGKKHLNFL